MIVKNADGVSMAIINSYVNVKDSSVLEEENFKDSFNPELFKKTATRVVDMLKNHLDDTQHRGLQLENPKILLEQARELMASHSQDEVLNKEKLNSILDLYMSTGIPVQSNGYMGRQFSSPLPLAGIVGLSNKFGTIFYATLFIFLILSSNSFSAGVL